MHQVPGTYIFKSLLILVVWTCLFFSGLNLFAQEHRIRFKHISVEDGLSMEAVNCIIQDGDGYLWMGTQEGLNRFDGYSFKLFLRDDRNPHGLKGNFIFSLGEAPNGNIMIGTLLAGLQIYDRESGRFSSVQAPEDQPIRVLAFLTEKETDQVWLITPEELYTLDFQTKRLSLEASSEGMSLRTIVEDPIEPGKLWIGGEQGLFYFPRGGSQLIKIEGLPHIGESGNPGILHMAVDQGKKAFWLGLRTGLMKFDLISQQGSLYMHDPDDSGSMQQGLIKIVCPDARDKNLLWLGSDRGLGRFDKNTGRVISYTHSSSNANSLSSNITTGIIQDQFHNTWVSTLGKGVSRFRSTSFVHYSGESDPNAPGNKVVRTILADAFEQDILWLGYVGAGLSRLDRKTNRYTHFKKIPGDETTLFDDTVNGLGQDWDGRLWVGTESGLCLLDKESGQFQRIKVPGNLVSTVVPDHQRREIWYGSVNGIGRYNPTTQQISLLRAPEDQITIRAYEQVASLAHDVKRNLLYAGAYGGGIRVFDPEKGLVKRYEGVDEKGYGLPSPMVGGIELDNKGFLWAGTARGLARINLDTHEIDRYERTWGPGLATVYATLQDNQGKVWMSTQYGISVFDPATGFFRDFGLGDGLQGREFNADSAFAAPSGELFFGGTNGFNAFFPKEIKHDLNPPHVHINQFLLLNRPVKTRDWDSDSPLTQPIEFTKTLELDYNQRMFAFEFAASYFHQASLMRYAYKLEPFDSHWIETGFRYRRANYTAVPYGSYQFRVKAANRDGVWGDETVLKVRILPPIWLTWWAKALYVLAIAAVIFWYVRFQALMRRRLQERVKERTSDLVTAQKALVEAAHLTGMAEIAGNMLHEVGNRLNSVRTSTGIIRDRAMEHKVSHMLERIIKLFEEHEENPDAFFDSTRLEHLRSGLIKIHQNLEIATSTVKEESDRLEAHLDEVEKALSHNLALSQVSRKKEVMGLKRVVKNALHMEDQLLNDSNIKCECRFLEDPPVALVQTTFLRILTYLLDNAREALAHRKEGREIMIELYRKNQWTVLEIQDNGSGVAQEHLTRVFAQGFTTRENGKGFGLHYSANAMTGMDGRIDLTSDGPGKGATVRLFFPSVNESG